MSAAALRRPAHVGEFAQLVGRYYKALLQNGVHEELAGQLVRDWHARYIGPESVAPALGAMPDDLADVEHVSKRQE